MAKTPVYQGLYDDLRNKISSGDLQPGTKIASESELAAAYKIARGSVRTALVRLANEGLLESAPGRGTFVRAHVMLTYHGTKLPGLTGSSGDGYMTTMALEGRSGQQALEVRMVNATADRARRLWVDEGETLVERRLVRYVDDQPWSLQVSHYPMRIAADSPIMRPENVAEGTTRWLAEHGHEQIGRIDEITGRLPTPEESEVLDLSNRIPVIVLLRTAYTATEPVRVTETVFPADRNRLVYELGELRIDPDRGEA